MRTLTALLQNDKRVFIYLANDNLKRKFLRQAEDEGFVLHGNDPTKERAADIMIIHRDYTLSHLSGFATMGCYQNCRKEMRVDYARYSNGLADYYYDLPRQG
ncbi:MAG: hypothetical protein IJ168_07855 [Eubacterium sp.]|nr:hypothetical protein [Eubacterium sp.]